METRLRFGEFELYPERFELCRAGHTLRLERKPMELLILLTVRQGSVVPRTEIAEHLWGSEVFVDTEHGINTAVRKLRQVLRDDPDKPRFIQTVPKLGYRFVAPVSTDAELAELPAPVLAPVETPRPPADPARFSPRARVPGLAAGLGIATLCLLLALAAIVRYRHRDSVPQVSYEQLTDLTDSAVAPALSPDGHTLAFIRGDQSFGTEGPIYVKALPNGEERPVTNDARPKYGLVFSPDGSRIAYTVFGTDAFETYAVSIFGGDPILLLRNAAGLSWLSADQLLFSKVRSGIHLGVVTGTATDGATRDVYFPAHQRGMAHYSHASPDRRWVLVVEMDSNGHWAPCRLVALADHSDARVVGPGGACTAAAWSTDGRWMYFTAIVDGRSHLWRQRFPQGVPQQITFDAAEEDGLAVDATGNSLITSIGNTQSALWIHDDKGERALSSEGEVLNDSSPPLFRQNDSVLYYLLRHKAGSAGAELRRVEAQSGKVEVVVPGVSIRDYDVSPDGRQVVFSTTSPAGGDLWLAPTDRSSLPARMGVQGATVPHFGPGNRIVFLATEGNANYLEQTDAKGLGRSKLVAYPTYEFQGVSPGGHWAMALVSELPGSIHPTLVAIPFDGSRPRKICDTYCLPRWATSGKWLFFSSTGSSAADPGQSMFLPVGPNENLADLPPEGIPVSSASRIPAAKYVAMGDLVAGKDPEHYAFVKTTVQRNLFRVTLR